MAQSFTIPGIGDVIADRYRIDAVIGKGGFGVVYRATQIGMEREVALKTLLPSAMIQDDMVERFRREAILARNLNHPNTIRLYDFGQTDGGLLYIAMEYLEGVTLRQLLRKEGPLPPGRVKNIALQMLKSLAEAHQHDVVHRDLKPSNIIIGNVVGETDFVKILDFGIAKIMNASDEEEYKRQLTQTGTSFGTPNYMAPEQVRSKGIGPCTDLYALGLLMSECLTGTPTFKGESAMDIAVQQLSPEPVPIPDWVLRGPLGPVIQRATQKEIALRYPSAVEMLRDLKSVDPNASLDISASIDANRAQEVAGEGRSVGLKKSTLVALAVLVALLLISGTVVLTILLSGRMGGAPTVEKPTANVGAPVPEEPSRAALQEETSGPSLPVTNPSANVEKPPVAERVTEDVKISVYTTPKGATVWDQETPLGETPLTLDLARSKTPKVLVIRHEGYQDETLEVSLSEESEHRIPMRPLDTKDPEPTVTPNTSQRRSQNAAKKFAERTRSNAARKPTGRKDPKGATKTKSAPRPKTSQPSKEASKPPRVIVPSVD